VTAANGHGSLAANGNCASTANGNGSCAANGDGASSAHGNGSSAANGDGASGAHGNSSSGDGVSSAHGNSSSAANGDGASGAHGNGSSAANGGGASSAHGNGSSAANGDGASSAHGNGSSAANGDGAGSAHRHGSTAANGNGTSGTNGNGASANNSRAKRSAKGGAGAPRHVLVTGAAGAIGGALARAMRAAWPTTRLALLDRDASLVKRLADELGNASAHGHDLRDITGLPKLVAMLGEIEPLDGLVNCAGIMRVQHVASWKWEDAQDTLAIDLLAPLRLQDLVVPAMVERHRGVIVNVASMAGRVPLKGCTYYGASKAGLAMASEIARAELAPHGIRVVTVYPGPVKSALEQGARDAWGGGGFLGRFAPLGDPAELARRIMAAIADDEPRVIYPRLYGVGWSATNLSSWFALSYGPPAMS
jgi:short-subunit dehydrogenase